MGGAVEFLPHQACDFMAVNWIYFPFQGYEGSLIKLTSKQVRCCWLLFRITEILTLSLKLMHQHHVCPLIPSNWPGCTWFDCYIEVNWLTFRQLKFEGFTTFMEAGLSQIKFLLNWVIFCCSYLLGIHEELSMYSTCMYWWIPSCYWLMMYQDRLWKSSLPFSSLLGLLPLTVGLALKRQKMH